MANKIVRTTQAIDIHIANIVATGSAMVGIASAIILIAINWQ